MSYAVKLADISYAIEDVSLFSGLSFSVPTGTTGVITGSSGSGKSKCIEMIAGVIEPTGGSVLWDTTDIYNCSFSEQKKLRINSSMVFQQHALITYLPLFENVALPLRHHKIGSKEEIDQKVTTLFETLELTSYAWRLPETLSEGVKRLGSIARALINRPQLLCMDEPTERLDTVQKNLFLTQFEKLQGSDTTIIVTTNDTELLQCAGSNKLTL